MDPEPDYERGGVKALPERQYVEGGPRKLAMEKISLQPFAVPKARHHFFSNSTALP